MNLMIGMMMTGKNLGDKCDFKSCYMCDVCKFDADINDNDMAEKETKTQKKFYCNGCERLKKLTMHTGSTIYNNLYCMGASNSGSDKLIDISIPDSRMVRTQGWCPINKALEPLGEGETEKIDLPTTPMINKKKTWQDFKAQIKFEDIKEGEVYHIPPYNTTKRKDILITKKNGDFSATYKILNGSTTCYVTNTLWPNTIEARLLTKHKIMNIEVGVKH